jgi:ABC-type lipoprotein export system ATPase subunit
MIALVQVSKTYAPNKKTLVPAVREVTLKVEPGEFVVVTGRSGSGKTTLLNLVADLTRPTSGQILINGADLWSLSDPQQALLRNRTMGFVFQFPSLMPSLTAIENVMLPRMFGDSGKRSTARARATQLLEEVGLAHKQHSLPRHLSGGEQQRVVIARSLMNQPEMLLADEPTSDLDELTEQEIMTLFHDVHARTGVTVLLVTHASELERYGTRGVKMVGGRIVEGTA